MKIAVVGSICNTKSGARAPLEIAKALSRKNRVTFYAKPDNKDTAEEKRLKQFGVDVIFVTTPGELLKHLNKEKYDVISTHTTPAFTIASYLSGIPLVSTYYGTQLNVLSERFFEKNTITFLLNKLFNLVIFVKTLPIVWLPRKVVAISKFTSYELKRIHGRKSSYIYLGNVPKHFTTLNSQRITLNSQRITVFSVSRITPYKQFEKIISAVNILSEKYKNIRLVIAGSAPQANYLKFLRSLKKSNTTILTDISEEKLIELYSNCDIYVTADKYLFFGMPVLESASMGKPGVAFDFAAAKEVIQDQKTGFVVKNENELQNSLEKLIKNKNLRNRLGLNAKKFAKGFTWSKTADEYQKVFNKVTKESYIPWFFYISVVIVVGILLRLANLNSHTFWFDEAFSYFVAKRPTISLLYATAADNHPPFYYLVLNLWMRISESPVFLRLLSLIFGVVSLPLFFRLAKKLTAQKTALIGTLIFALSPLHIYYSTETRMYSIFIFETLLIFWLFFKFAQTKNLKILITLTIVEIITLYTHYYAAFVILTLNLLFFLEIKKVKNLIFRWLFSNLTILFAFLPWLSLVLQNPNPNCWCFKSFISVPVTFVSFAVNGLGLVSLKSYLYNAPKVDFVIFFLTSITIFTLFIIGVVGEKRNSKLLLIFFVPILFLSAIGMFKSVFSPRSVMFLSPFYYLFVAVGILDLGRKMRIYIATALIILILSTLTLQLARPFYYGPQLEEASRAVEKSIKSNEAVLHTSPMTFYSFQYFHKFKYPEYLVIPSDTASGTIFEIGGYKKSAEEIVPFYSSLWLVTIPYWVTKEEVEMTESTLQTDHKIDQEIRYNSLYIYHYSKK